MNVLSLFDGIASGRLALKRVGIKPKNYFASEVDKYAITIAEKNWSRIKEIGDVTNINGKDLPKIDLLIGGSPCQGFSFAGKGLNFEDPRSKLFFEFVRLLKETKPKYFLLENVTMKKEYEDIITKSLGVNPVMINSSLVSAQNRKRLYWTNIPFRMPMDKGIILKDILLPDAYPVVMHNLYGGFGETKHRTFQGKSPTLRTSAGGGHIPSLLLSKNSLSYMNRKTKDGRTHWDFAHHSDSSKPKSATVVANFFKGVPYNVLKDKELIRKFDPIECERLQTLPDNYTEGVSDTQRYKMIGNGWTVDVIAHIFSYLASHNKTTNSNLPRILALEILKVVKNFNGISFNDHNITTGEQNGFF